MRRLFFTFGVVLVGILAGVALGFGQDNERSTLIRYVEEQISSPSYQIRLNGIDGTLSSDVSLESITIADQEGIWLTIENPRMVWTRSALLTGKLQINSLEAERVIFERPPVEDTSLPAPESSGFALPDLPVAVVLERLALPLVEVGEPVIDLAFNASLAGKFMIDGGVVDIDLEGKRLDGGGGFFKALTNYEQTDQTLFLDVELAEPQGGAVATAMGIEGRPPVKLTLKGDAPLKSLRVELGLDVDEKRIVDGSLQFAEADGGIDAVLTVEAFLSGLLAPEWEGLLGQQGRLDARMQFADTGAIALQQSSLSSGAVSLSANGITTPDGFLSGLNADLRILAADGATTVLPLEGQSLSFTKTIANLSYNAERSENWSGELEILGPDNGLASADAVRFNAQGTVQNLDQPEQRAISFSTLGGVSGLSSSDPSLASALGKSIVHRSIGSWRSGEPLQLERFTIEGNAIDFSARGEFANGAFDGATAFDASDLQVFSALAGNDLKGRLALATRGMVAPLSGQFDLELDGTARGLAVGNEILDPLLVSETRLSGGFSRDNTGLRFDGFRVANRDLVAEIKGGVSSRSANLDALVSILDLSVIEAGSSGPAKLAVNLSGPVAPFKLITALEMPEGKLVGQAVNSLEVRFDGQLDGKSLNGKLSSSGSVSAHPLRVEGNVNVSSQSTELDALLVALGATEIRGHLSRTNEGLITAELDVGSSDISAISALALSKASGGLYGKISLKPESDNTQSADFDLDVDRLVFNEILVGSATLKGTGNKLLSNPKLDAVVKATDVSASGLEIRTLAGSVANEGSKTTFDLDTQLSQHSARIQSAGTVEQGENTLQVVLEKLIINSRIADASLNSATKIEIRDGVATLDRAVVSIDGGTIEVWGTTGAQLDLAATLNEVPLSVLNAVQPELGAVGAISGSLTATGKADNPTVVFNLNGRGLSLRQVVDAGLEPLLFNGSGTYADKQIRLERFTTENTQGLALSGSADIPLQGNGLSTTINGNAPLAIVEPLLAERATRVEGLARIAIIVGGSVDAPLFSGGINVAGATVVDPLSNLKMESLDLVLDFVGSQSASLRAQGNLASGGSLSANGTIGLTGGLPADLALVLTSTRYSDGETFNGTIDGRLALTGELLSSPLLSGSVDVLRLDISVPDSFAAQTALLDVQHVSPSGETQETLDRIDRVTPKQGEQSDRGNLRLDVNVNAPNQIFVRGRGLDAELGGRIQVTGSLSNVVPIGGFTLRRGRLSILGQRLDLQEGTITLAGDLDPVLDFLAVSRSSDAESYIRLQGPASNLMVSFSSNPELPEDEVLAQIVFGRSMTDLSPLQIARLASVAVELTGGNSPSLVDGLRETTGLDDIDVVQDDDGNAAVKAGKYVSDNVYLGVQTGQETEATINLDITENLKARGAVTSEGESSLGLFFEQDY